MVVIRCDSIRHDPLAAIICHACYPLCSIGALDAIKFAVPVAFFVAFQCGFPIFFFFFFAAIARGPLAFATRWIWAADYNLALSWLTFSRQTAAVRAPLCLRFPLLLGSVQAGVGLLSPPPTRRCGCCLLWHPWQWWELFGDSPLSLPFRVGACLSAYCPFRAPLVVRSGPIGRGPQSHPVVASGDGGSCSGIPLSPRPGR